MSAQKKPTAAEQLEADIAAALQRMNDGTTTQEKLVGWLEASRLHAMRTQGTIERMEREKGLSR